MKDHQSPEAVGERASQEDPIVMYLIVHESLGMGMGKTAAQCAHASQMLTLEYFRLKKISTEVQKRLNAPKVEPSERSGGLNIYKTMSAEISIFTEWINSSVRKVVLRASDKEWEKLKEEFKDNMVMVVDAGLTEIPSGTETCIGLWPIRKSQRSKTIQRLQVLK